MGPLVCGNSRILSLTGALLYSRPVRPQERQAGQGDTLVEKLRKMGGDQFSHEVVHNNNNNNNIMSHYIGLCNIELDFSRLDQTFESSAGCIP